MTEGLDAFSTQQDPSAEEERDRDARGLGRGLHVEALEPRLLLSADLIPVSGSLDAPGEEDRYVFELTEATDLYFDSLTPSDAIRWSLEGPDGPEVSGLSFSRSDGDDGGAVLALDAGRYTLSINGDGDAVGAYQFRLLDLDNAAPINPGVAVSGVLENGGRETDLYQFQNAVAGQEVFFDLQSVSGGTPDWRLYAPDGALVFGPSDVADRDRLALEQVGAYTLMIEGDVANVAEIAYQIDVQPVADDVQALTLGATTVGRIDHQGQRDLYNFSLAADATLFFDALSTPDRVVWSLEGPESVVVESRAMSASDGSGGGSRLDLVAGDYTLIVDGVGDARQRYAFRLLEAASATRIDLAQPTTVVIGDAGATGALLREPSTAPSASSASDQALTLSDSDGFVSIADDASLRPTELSVEAWVKRAAGSETFDGVLMKSSSNSWSDGYGLFYDDSTGSYTFFVNNYFGESSVSAAVPEERWTHLAGTFDGATLRLYVDGALAAESAYAQPINHSLAELRIGAGSGNLTSWRHEGEIDEARIWSRALSAAEIADNFLSQRAGGEAGLVGYWRFDEAGGLQVLDSSTSGNSGALSQVSSAETRLYRFSAQAGQRLLIDVDAAQSGVDIRLFRPEGGMILDALGAQTRDDVVLPVDGDYLIALEGDADAVATSFQLTLHTEVEGRQTVALGDAVAGSIAAPAERDVYAFTLASAARVYVDSLTDRSDIRWSLTGPRGLEATRAFSASDSSSFGANAAFDLPAGAYEIAVDGDLAAVGAYAFRLLDLSNATRIAYGAAQSASLDPANETEVFVLAASAGDQLRVSGAGGIYGRLINPFGREVARGGSFGALNAVTLTADGDYLLLLEGRVSAVAPQTVDFTAVLDGNVPPVFEGAPYAVGDRVDGEIAVADEIDKYRFSVTTPTQIVFDTLLDASGVTQWSLRGPNGVERPNQRFASADSVDVSGATLYELAPGEYEISISGALGGVGSYAFRLIDVATATPAAVDTPITGVLQPKRETDVYRFDAAAGDRFFFDLTSLSGASNGPYWRLFDPFGRFVAGPTALASEPEFALPASGSYTLLIEGRRTESETGQIDYAFTIVTPSDADGGALPVGAIVSGAIPEPAGRVVYDLTLAEDKRLVFDELVRDSQLTFQIVGGAGFARSWRSASADSVDSSLSPVFDLDAGAYQVIVDSRSDDTPDYAFRLLDAAAATPVTLGAPTTVTLDPARGTEILAIDATAGRQYFIDFESQTGTAYFRLIDPFGREELSTRTLTDEDTRVFQFDGRYLLLLEGRSNEPEGRAERHRLHRA